MNFLAIFNEAFGLNKLPSYFGPDDPPPPPGDPPPPPPPPPPGGVFTQKDVDKFLAEDRRKHKAKQEQLANELEQLKQAKGLTDEQRASLESQIEELKNSSMTKEQQLTRDLEKQKEAAKAAAEAVVQERDKWQQRYGSLLVTNKITEAATSNKAFRTEQIADILMPRAKVVEKKGEDGKGIGEFDVLIRFEDIDVKTKEPVILDLTPDATVKRMKELPERFGNLFESGLQGGVGRTKTGGPVGEPDVTKMTAEEYREYRKTRKLQ